MSNTISERNVINQSHRIHKCRRHNLLWWVWPRGTVYTDTGYINKTRWRTETWMLRTWQKILVVSSERAWYTCTSNEYTSYGSSQKIMMFYTPKTNCIIQTDRNTNKLNVYVQLSNSWATDTNNWATDTNNWATDTYKQLSKTYINCIQTI